MNKYYDRTQHMYTFWTATGFGRWCSVGRRTFSFYVQDSQGESAKQRASQDTALWILWSYTCALVQTSFRESQIHDANNTLRTLIITHPAPLPGRFPIISSSRSARDSWQCKFVLVLQLLSEGLIAQVLGDLGVSPVIVDKVFHFLPISSVPCADEPCHLDGPATAVVVHRHPGRKDPLLPATHF